MVLTGCHLPYTPLNKKQHSCKETIICEKHAVHPLMRLGLIFIFLHGVCFQQRDFTSSKASAMKTRQFLKKNTMLAERPYVNKYNTLFNEIKPHHYFLAKHLP